MKTTLEVTSRSNSWFRRIREAIASHGDEIVLEGPKQVQDAIELGWKPIAVALAAEAPLIRTSSPVLRFSGGLFGSVSETIHSQGVIGLFERPAVPLREIFSSKGLVVILDGVQDPGNVGVIIRLAAAFEAAGVILTDDSADPFGPKAIRASSSAILLVPVARASRGTILDLASEMRVPLFAADGTGDAIAPPQGPSALIFGSEGSGVSEAFLAVSRKIRIPISPRMESLNVASAAAILMEARYRRGHATS